MNSIRMIVPYWQGGTWCFDDAAVGLYAEPFVSGADTAITAVLDSMGMMPSAKKGFTMLFSDIPFPSHQLRVDWVRAEFGGNVYVLDMGEPHELWLCPALLKYFVEPPSRIHIQIKPLLP